MLDFAVDAMGLAIAVRRKGGRFCCQVYRADPHALCPSGQSLYTRKKKGPGLGLPLTKRIVNPHGSKLEIAGSLRQGNAATVRFPHGRLLAAQRTAVAATSGRTVA
jgi:hypothetical protein